MLVMLEISSSISTSLLPDWNAELNMDTVIAVDWSMLFFQSGMFVVGPKYACAHPGPTCYRKGDPLTVTDDNLFVGRYFPKIFGPDDNQCLDVDATRKVFEKLQGEINHFNSFETPGCDHLTLEEVAMELLDFSCAFFGPDAGFVSIASHIPNHLVSILDAMQYQMRSIEIAIVHVL
ncbi:unnamed protein product [Clavelina lepadiformis]|uniref:Hydantoinase A/oxoprolinase domain-containing protein n=1 Tax=Clavelina lepadiformis TaxID=159417 RepID=A0ABP0FQZ0_CLALP